MKNMKKKEAHLIIADSEKDANMYYATHFVAPDAFIFFEVDGDKNIVLSDLEVDRGRKQASMCHVLSLSEWQNYCKRKGKSGASLAEISAVILKSKGMKKVVVPFDFPSLYMLQIKKSGLDVHVKNSVFFESRSLKTPEEQSNIESTQASTEEAMGFAERVLRKSRVGKSGELIYEKEILTSEKLRRMMHVCLMENNCAAAHTIIACGNDACDPHCEGSGALMANQSIIIDIFPRSLNTFYFADMTRTFVKGKASQKLKKIYNAVRTAQEEAMTSIQDGADGKKIHRIVEAVFEKHGFKTSLRNGRHVGFFHGTGHGVGLEIHELPRISKLGDVLYDGNVVTVEPGLYYPGEGAVRLEDIVVVEKNGMRNITRYPKVLEIL